MTTIPSPAHGLERELYRKLVDFISGRDHIDRLKAEAIIERLSISELTMLEMQARGAVISETRSGNREVTHVVMREPQAMFTSEYDPFAKE